MPTLFMDGELPAGDIDERLSALGIKHNPDAPLYILSDAYSSLLGLPRAHLANGKWRQEMKRILTDRNVKCWVIDNVSSLASGLDENSKKDWDPINNWLLDLRFAGITTISLHHTGKGGSQRGTSAREDNADCSLLLKKPNDYTPDDGCRFIINFDKARVSQKDLHLISDTEFKLIETPEGTSSWSFRSVRKEIKKECLRMLSEGIDYESIKEVLGISKPYISKMKKQFTNDGLLHSQEKLTVNGIRLWNGNE